MEKTYVMADDKAKELKKVIETDIEKGIYNAFHLVALVLLDVLRAIEKKVPFTYEQDCTLRANGYTKGIVADWYYPKVNDWKIVRDKK